MDNTEIMTTPQQTAVVSKDNIYSSTQAFNELFKIGNVMSKTQLVPDNYRNKPEDCTIAIDIANRNGMSPLSVMQNLYVVKGKPTWSGQACIAMIRASKEYEHVKPVMVGERNTDGWGCYFKAIDKSDGEVAKGTLVTIKMAKDEGWYSKPGSKWPTMPELMLQYRAAAFFARIYMPNVLMGFSVEGEVEDISPVPVQAPPDPFANTKVAQEASEVFDNVID
nr:MAG TPA: RecT protein [Caudoviricetes sp.]DAP33781.1 MAG TPA: RecT protein [Caudoviricetes sp.]DAU31397.1 MAG TPA: RecT protein [Caudoviricetes sp.]